MPGRGRAQAQGYRGGERWGCGPWPPLGSHWPQPRTGGEAAAPCRAMEHPCVPPGEQGGAPTPLGTPNPRIRSGCPWSAREEREGLQGDPSPRSAREMPPSPPGLGRAGGLLQHPSASPGSPHPPRAPSTSFPLPGSRKPEPPEQLPGVDPASTPPPTLPGARGPPKPLGDVQGAAPLFALSHPLQQVRSGLGALWWWWGGRHGGGEAPSPMHPWWLRTPGCVLGAALPREPEQRVKR